MTLIWSKEEDPTHRPYREMPRNTGQLCGRLDALLPFIYFAESGATARAVRQRVGETPGLFVVGSRTAGSRPGIQPNRGLVLPLQMCRDEAARAALGGIPSLMADPHATLSQKRGRVQVKLDVAFRGGVSLVGREVLDGYFALQPGPALFRQLCESFDYVTDVVDNPAGLVRVTGSTRFRWPSYGELMEWFHTRDGVDLMGVWPRLTPYFVCGNTGALQSFASERWARAGLHRPATEPSKWFVIRPGLVDAEPIVRLEMGQYGWASLRISLNAETATIRLSEVFDPFDELVAWGQEIESGDLPVAFEIDEEGSEVTLIVLRTEDPLRVLLRIVRVGEGGVLAEGIVARSSLATGLKTELRRFFMSEFDPRHWDMSAYDDEDDGEDDGLRPDFVPTKQRVLNHRWLAA